MNKYNFFTIILTPWLICMGLGGGMVAWSLSADGIRGHAIREDAWMIGLIIGLSFVVLGVILAWYRLQRTGSLFNTKE